MQFRHTTRGRLILIVAAALLPALGVIFWTGLEQRDEAVRNAERQVLLLTRHFAERQQELTATTEQILRTLADVHRHHEHDANTCLKILRAADDHNDIYSRLLIVSPDGRVRISSKGKGERDVSERKYFRDVLASKSFSAGEYVVDGDTGHATIHFVYPLLNRKGEIGKRLDFLIQELPREANTMGAKSAALSLTHLSVDMKVLIEQMREQVQNIE